MLLCCTDYFLQEDESESNTDPGLLSHIHVLAGYFDRLLYLCLTFNKTEPENSQIFQYASPIFFLFSFLLALHIQLEKMLLSGRLPSFLSEQTISAPQCSKITISPIIPAVPQEGHESPTFRKCIIIMELHTSNNLNHCNRQ